MKYVAKVDADNFLVSISKEEILMLMYGEERPEYNESIKQEVRSFLEKLNNGRIDEVSFAPKFRKILSLYHAAKEFDNWQSFTKKMDDIKDLFQPVKEYIDKFKDLNKY